MEVQFLLEGGICFDVSDKSTTLIIGERLFGDPPVVRVNTVCRLNFMCFDDKQLRTYRTLHGQVFFGKSSVSTRTTGREIQLWVVLYAVRNRCITQESQIWYDSGGGIKDYTLKLKTYDFQQIHRLHCYSFEKQFSLVNMVF